MCACSRTLLAAQLHGLPCCAFASSQSQVFEIFGPGVATRDFQAGPALASCCMLTLRR